MAHFRAYVRGNRSEASRLGSKNSGISSNTASWEGAVSVYLWHDETTGKDMARVSLSRHHGRGTEKELYHGPVGGEETKPNV